MIRMRGIVKVFGTERILNGVDLDIEKGSFVALLGPSGSGKTTLLRMMAGLDVPDVGTIEIDGRDATGLRPGERRAGFVFQGYALFNHMTVFENVAFGLRVKKRAERPNEAAIREKVETLLSMVQLEGLGPRFQGQLSGGQQQRVALARALAVEPVILLLDEPFGALDHDIRQSLRDHLRELHDRLGLTTVFVSHDRDEAHALADRVVVLERGRIVGSGV